MASTTRTLEQDVTQESREAQPVEQVTRTTAAHLHFLNDSNILFEEYLHFAKITRAEEKLDEWEPKEKKNLWGTIKSHFKMLEPPAESSAQTATAGAATDNATTDEKGPPSHAVLAVQLYSHPNEVTDREWKVLSRAVRTASWSTAFWLVTSDIIGPFSIPWSFAQLGYGPGVGLYTVFGALAGLSGYYIWNIFIQMDSDRYPLRDYGAAFHRVFGPVARHIINLLQVFQMVLTLASLIIGMGQAIAQVSAGTSNPVCFVVCLLIFTLIGIVLGQVRTLQRFGWLSSFAVCMNMLAVFISMGVAANWPPNFEATEASFGPNFAEGPIYTYAGIPPDGMASGGDGLIGALNGLNQAVYGFAGAILFFNFLSEMRQPWDFWKSLVLAQVFIYCSYLFFGIFIYSYQGQYAFNPVHQGLSLYNYQTAANICYIMTGFIAAAMYGNIGIKIVYSNVFQELLGAPPLTIRSGKLLWIVMVPIYWAIAFVVGASVPMFSYISGLLSAVFFLTFTYSFPALLALGFRIKKAAMLPEESFDETTRRYTRLDNGLKRWIRGYMANWHINTFDLIYFLGSLVASALGTYSSIEALIDAFAGNSVATSWGCTPPV